jgi:peptidoglycan hydrolase-like amidase
LLNVVDLDQYVLGVVAKELPALFGIEPLRAQAVAARSYVLARRATGSHRNIGADACDSQHCQVYAGMVGEHPAGNHAVEATKGLVLLRNGALFEPMYSSACGGHTEAIGRLFDSDDDEAVADGELPSGINLKSDLGATLFFKKNWDSNCAGSNRYRWSYTWDRQELEATIAAGLRRYAGTSTVASSVSDARVSSVSNVAVAERGVSGRALALKIEGAGVEWTVKKDWGLRNFLRTPDGDALPSSAFALEQALGSDGKVAQLTAHGAGWGHGGGMCQWGTRGLAQRGMAYDAILGHYYPSADLAKVPS